MMELFKKKGEKLFNSGIVKKEFYVVSQSERGDLALASELAEPEKEAHLVILQKEKFLDNPFTIRIFFTNYAKQIIKHRGAWKRFRGFNREEIVQKIHLEMHNKGATLDDYTIDIKG